VASSRTRLELLGISDDQIDEVLKAGKANTHLKIRSPIAGHVIKKYIREGQYVDEGTPLYDIADLSSVWIQAQIYEDDLAFLPSEQAHKPGTQLFDDPLTVIATTRAYPDEEFEGKLTFIYPHVDQQTRTVTVRFEMQNPGHRLRPGTTATVKIKVPPREIRALTRAVGSEPELSQLDRLEKGLVLAIPESSVIDTGSQTIAYRETLPGVYEGVRVELGPRMSGPEDVPFFPVLKGLAAGELVVTSGSFLVDAETRLNPAAGSIYFGGSSGSKGGSGGSTVRPTTPEDTDAKITQALARLAPDERTIAEEQRFCPILSDNRLGSMGVPVKVMLDGQPVFLCCDGCKKPAQRNPEETLKKVARLKEAGPRGEPSPGSAATTNAASRPLEAGRDAAEEAEIRETLAKLSPADRALAEKQKFCAVLRDSRLGSMGAPIKLTVNGKTVFICCEGCQKKALANPEATLKALDGTPEQKKVGNHESNEEHEKE
jgi:hypothetical protein